MEETKHFRPTQEVMDKAQYLIDNYPDEYPRFSDVVRAGVVALHRVKIKGGGF